MLDFLKAKFDNPVSIKEVVLRGSTASQNARAVRKRLRAKNALRSQHETTSEDNHTMKMNSPRLKARPFATWRMTVVGVVVAAAGLTSAVRGAITQTLVHCKAKIDG